MPARFLVLVWGLSLCLAAGRAAAEPARSQHWAFQPVRRPAVPAVGRTAWVRAPLDAFVLARLEEKGIEPAPPADRRTLLRRVYLDLVGLPPTPAEQQAFLADDSPTALARVVDDLLSRPQYGERWARHWLDVARFAETNGYERDGAKPHSWRYRDYVIDAFNRDKPYDRFVMEQIAGDELPDTSAETQIATTFLRLGTWDDEPAEPTRDRYDQLDDVLGTTATAFLGVTLRCARCHDHKFEPFPQVDYYRMLAVFEPLKRPQLGRMDLDRAVGNPAELAREREQTKKADAEADALKEQIDALKTTLRDRLLAGTDKKTSLPPEAVAAFQAEAGSRTSVQKELVKRFAGKLEEEVRSSATAEEKGRLEELERRLAAVNAGRPKDRPRAYIWYEDSAKAPPTYVLQRGDPARHKQEVTPGLPAVLVGQQPEPPQPLARSTGRRLWLARWLTRPDNPLTARVIVNRVWQAHFGRGLVRTANDFGVMGEPPTHPELLDWLAAEFMAKGWSIKELHRSIILSSTYQMSSSTEDRQAGRGLPEAARLDPSGAMLSRWRQRRLEAEAVRDSILAVSGRLNPQTGGPGMYPDLPRAVLEGQSRPGEGWGKSDERQQARRSIYIYVKRALAVPELEVLDSPDTTSSCEQRIVSTIAPQALTFLNGEFANRQARHFAARLRREAGADAAAQVRLAFELALCRPPRPEEGELALAFLATQQKQIEADPRKAGKPEPEAARKALEALCLVILNMNEFVYVD
jgi:hypothetical protein